MKIGIVLYPTFGGSGVVATELGKALAKQGHEVHFITYEQPVKLDHFYKNIFYHEVKVQDYPLFDYPPYEVVLTSKLVDVSLFEKLDILHVHYAIPHASAAFMAREILKTKGVYVPFITTLHGTDVTLIGKDPSFEPVISFAINQSDAVTAVSDSLKDETYKYFEVTREIKVIHNFLCEDEFKIPENAASIKKEIAPNGEKILLHVSNFRKLKRVQDIIEIMNLLKDKANIKLLLVGDGPERAKAEILCRKYNLCDKIKFLGKMKDTDMIFAISDIFILPSEHESFGLAALQAMAKGKPVVSSNIGGIPEVNINGVTGFTENVGDIEAMAKDILRLATDDELYNRFSENALKKAKEFELSKILPLYEKLYTDVLENKRLVKI
jgi:N-acetyl-alpha-D-glucosaminyl L-malate synthase BshA